MPKLIKLLSVIGTIAMILVGGGILVHNIELFHYLHLDDIPSILQEFVIGFIISSLIVVVVTLIKKFKR